MLVLLPAYLSEDSPLTYFPAVIKDYIDKLDHYIVENEKTARKIIKFFNPEKKQSDLKLYPIDKHHDNPELIEAKILLKNGTDFGLLSEAGLPCIADPGSIFVKFCHKHQIQVIPITGPSSIILALISSGFNGQQFTFNGYLPIDKQERKKKIVEMYHTVTISDVTQIFMETPYRNNAILQDMLNVLPNHALLTIAANINDPQNEYIKTQKILDWKNKSPDIHKIPAIFLLGN